MNKDHRTQFTLCVLLGCLPGAIQIQNAQDLKEVRESFADGKLFRLFHVNSAGKRDGELREYSPDGILVQLAKYKNGRLHGSYKAFHSNGKRKLWTNYRNDLLVGRHTEFNDRGKKVLVTRYVKGKIHGKFETWYEGGQKKTVSQYKNGFLSGAHTDFYRDGKPRLLANYRAGKMHGAYEERNRKEHKILLANYQDGALHGDYKLKIEGQLVVDQVFAMDKVVKVDGVIIHPVSLKSLTSEILRLWNQPHKKVEEEALHHLQVFRFLCRVPYKDLDLHVGMNNHCKAAARICEMVKSIGHKPPKPEGMKPEEYKIAILGTSSSNLASSKNGLVSSIDQYMDDSGASNIAHVGHRRWCLNPRMRRTGFGVSGRYYAMWAIDAGGPDSHRSLVYYPPRGYVPVNLFGKHAPWSIIFSNLESLKKSKLKIRVVAMDDAYRKIPGELAIEDMHLTPRKSRAPCLIFRPKGVQALPGKKYWVELSFDKGTNYPLKYMVEFTAPVLKRVKKVKK